MMLVLLTIFAFNFESGRLMLEKTDSVYITHLLDSVRIYNDTMEIRGFAGVYNDKENVLFLKGDISLKTRNKIARSDSLVIRKNGNIILFMGGVEIITGKDTLRGDRVYIYSDTLIASSNVEGYLGSKNVKFRTDSLYGIDSTYVLRGANTYLATLDTDSIVFTGSPVYIKRDTIFSPSKCSVVTGKYRARGDTLYYFSADSMGFFTGDVVVSWDSGYSAGDTAYFYLSSGGLDSLLIKGKCFLQRKGEKNTVSLNGKSFKVYIENKKMKRLEAMSASGVLKEEESE